MLARTLLTVVASLAIAVACTAAPPAAPAAPTDTPTEMPTVATPTATPSPALPTTAPATPSAPPATPTSTPLSQDPDDFYGYDTPPPATATPASGDGAFVITLHGAGSAAYLLGPAERALYTFTNDSPGSSSCTGNCATTWPPLVIDATETATGGEGVEGALDTIARADGALQVTYNGAPLYYYAPDGAPSDTRGEGIGGVWFLARP